MKAIATALLLLGCEADAQSTHATTNPDVTAQLLFEHDGCKVYRFHDSGRPHYYVRCPDALAALETECRSQGKTVTCESERVEVTR